MVYKIIVVFALIAAVSAGHIPTRQVYHAAEHVLIRSQKIHEPHPQYQFSYSVNDAHTGDSKHQVETRDGDVVKGEYSLIDADGYKRTVHYTADDVHGFNAVVNREPLGHVVKAVHAVPVAYAAPTVIKSSPVVYAAAPTLVKSTHIGYAAPAAYAQTYSAAPGLVKSSHLGYAQSYAAAPFAYAHAPAAYTGQTYVISSPVAYTAPAYAYHH